MECQSLFLFCRSLPFSPAVKYSTIGEGASIAPANFLYQTYCTVYIKKKLKMLIFQFETSVELPLEISVKLHKLNNGLVGPKIDKGVDLLRRNL